MGNFQKDTYDNHRIMDIELLLPVNITSPWCSTGSLIFMLKFDLKFGLNYLKKNTITW